VEYSKPSESCQANEAFRDSLNFISPHQAPLSVFKMANFRRFRQNFPVSGFLCSFGLHFPVFFALPYLKSPKMRVRPPLSRPKRSIANMKPYIFFGPRIRGAVS
jgi:hypothetical protein